ncbi:hypothetical protein PR048_026074 [Dryococelus australis]|uniref:Uncharacterized protein n=1 Tax=Dryococelus australis TaxID=614101 RepID=A0ABQ9GKD5_9NEOP|nr:hypothetical protein PR048_026074 [Dryococelus australis]
MQVKSSGLEVMETEATVASAQNRLADIKEEVSVLQGQLTEVRAQKLHIVHNQERHVTLVTVTMETCQDVRHFTPGKGLLVAAVNLLTLT